MTFRYVGNYSDPALPMTELPGKHSLGNLRYVREYPERGQTVRMDHCLQLELRFVISKVF